MSIRGERASNEVDIRVGARIRVRRKLRGMSQTQLAGALGLTFQQVQKYERGSNRVSASKLYEIARTLEVPIAYFFQGLPNPASGANATVRGADRDVAAFLAEPGALDLLRAFARVTQPGVRRDVIALLQSLGQDQFAQAGSDAPGESATVEESGDPSRLAHRC